MHEMFVQAVSTKCIYNWFKRFRDGKETSEDEHVRVSRRQAEPQTWSSECNKSWHKISEWLYD